MAANVKDLLDRFNRLVADRGIWESHWQSLAEVLLPNRATFTHQGVKGERKMRRIYDSTPMLARRGLTSALDGLIKPKERKWFRIKASDASLNNQEEAKRWLQESEDRMLRAIYNRQARFITHSGEVDNDLVTFGTGVLLTEEAPQLNRLSFRSVPLQNAFLGVNHEGDIDTIFLRFFWTARQAAQRYGEDSLGEKTREALKQPGDRGRQQRFQFVQAVTPRTDRDPRSSDSENMPFMTAHIDVSSEHLIGEGGYQEFPFAVPRWDTNSDEIYGRSPGMLALPDSNTLQAMDKTLLVAGQKSVDPPLLAADDAVLGTPRTFPGGVTYTDGQSWREMGGPPIRPLETGANIPLGREMQNDRREQIWSAFFKNVLNLPVDGPQMTATEVLERKEEFIRTIGPTFGRLESDYVGQVVERVFNVMKRAGAFPEPPETLAGREVIFEFASPVQQARKQIEAAGAARSIEVLEPFIAADPEIMDNFDGDAIARDMPDAFGLPLRWMRPEEQVDAIREQRQQQQLAAAAAEAALNADPEQLEQLTEAAGNATV